jgi:hypothetical protein
MDYNSLNARFQQIKQTENETLQKVDEIIDATNGLSK